LKRHLFIACIVSFFAFPSTGKTDAATHLEGSIFSSLASSQIIDGPKVAGDLSTNLFFLGGCTATLIGPQTLLTAAHCVESTDVANPQEVRDLSLEFDGRIFPMQCEMAPGYSSHRSQTARVEHSYPNEDFALCFLPENVLGGASNRFERIDIESLPSVGAMVTVAGFGCRIFPEVQVVEPLDLGNIRLLRTGTTSILEANIDKIVVDQGSGSVSEVSICPGDSGGPLFLRSGEPLENPSAKRQIVGVNSVVGPVDGSASTSGGVSIFSTLSSQSFTSFIQSWSAKNNAKICGFNIFEEEDGCRP